MAAEWQTTTLSDVCSEVRYGYTAKAVDTDTGVRFLRGTDISGRDHIDWNRVPFCEISPQEESRYSLEHGDIVIVRMGTIGETAIIKHPPRSVCASYLIRHRINTAVAVPAYVHYVLRSPMFAAFIQSHGGGSVQPNINATVLGEFTFTLPPVPVQQAIANVLSALDDKIALLHQMNCTLETSLQSLFKTWFVDFGPVRRKAHSHASNLPMEIDKLFPERLTQSPLGMIPEGWRVTTLGDLSEKPQYGYTASATSEPVGPRFLRITDINKRDWIEWQHVPFCPIDERDMRKYRLAKGDLVIARMADPGHGALIEEDVDAVFASYLIRFRPLECNLARYLQYWLRSDSYWGLVRSRQSGTTRANLNAQVLSAFTLVVPTPELLGAFTKQADGIRNKLVSNVGMSLTLTELRDALLPTLLTGALEVDHIDRIIGRAL